MQVMVTDSLVIGRSEQRRADAKQIHPLVVCVGNLNNSISNTGELVQDTNLQPYPRSNELETLEWGPATYLNQPFHVMPVFEFENYNSIIKSELPVFPRHLPFGIFSPEGFFSPQEISSSLLFLH